MRRGRWVVLWLCSSVVAGCTALFNLDEHGGPALGDAGPDTAAATDAPSDAGTTLDATDGATSCSSGALDTTFGDGGVVARPATVGIGVRPFGLKRTFVGGTPVVLLFANAQDRALRVVRFDENGTIDSTLADGGVLSVFDPHAPDAATLYGNSSYVSGTGAAFLAGDRYEGAGRAAFLLNVRADGVVDPTFGDGGETLFAFGTSANAWAVDRESQNGRFVVSGAVLSATEQAVLAWATTSGTPQGMQTLGLTDSTRTTAMAIDGDNNVILTGYSKAADGVDRLFVAKLLPTGTLVNGFPVVVAHPTETTSTRQRAPVVIDTTASVTSYSIVVAGTFGPKSDQSGMVARFDKQGGLVKIFEPLPKTALVDAGGGDAGPTLDNVVIRDIALQTDGRILVGGGMKARTGVNSDSLLVARYNADGSLDRTFGGRGWVRLDPRQSHELLAMTIVNGRLWLTGCTGGADETCLWGSEFLVARLCL
jgi:uncharacterized delta-60 repeat protein